MTTVFQRPNGIKIVPQNDRVQDLLNLLEIPVEKVREILISLEASMSKNFKLESVGESEIRRMKTFIRQLPSGKENGTFHTICVSEKEVCAYRVEVDKGSFTLSARTSARFCQNNAPVSFYSPTFTASSFLATVMEAITKMINSGDQLPDGVVNFVMSSSVPLELESIDSASFRLPSALACSNDNEDPVYGLDVVDLLNIGLARAAIKAAIIGICNEETAILIAGSYVRTPSMRRCLMSLEVGEGLAVCFVQPNPEDFGLDHSVWGVDVTAFTGTTRETAENNYRTRLCLPLSSVDVELAASECVNPRLLEQIVTITFIPEICRKLIILVFQDQTPSALWVPNSLPAALALSVLCDPCVPTAALHLLEECWAWKATRDQAEIVHNLIVGTFSRSAAVVAVIIAVVAKRTGRMQPALGGVSCAMSGILGTNQVYQSFIRKHLDTHCSTVHKTATAAIQFVNVESPAPKGAALLNCIIQNMASK